jgi:hypothetical protein
MMCRQNSANQLIGMVYAACIGKLGCVEDRFKIPVPKNKVSPSSLKAVFCQLRLNQEMAQAHIDFGSIGASTNEWCPDFNAELGPQPWLSPKKSAQRLSSSRPRIAENIHEKRIGAIGAIQFAPGAVGQLSESLAGGVTLVKPASPVGRSTNAPIGSWQKVAVLTIHVLIQNAGNGAVGRFMNDPLRTFQIAGAEFTT